MRKIKNIKQLQEEKLRIKLHQQELENKLQLQWEEIKKYIKPANVAAATFTAVIKNVTENKTNDKSFFKNIFSYGVSLLANKMADKAGEKISHIFHKKQTA